MRKIIPILPNIKHYPSDMFSSAPSLCSLIFLFQHSFPISLAPSVCLSPPIQPPDLFFDPDRCCILEDLCLRFPSTAETFNFCWNLTVTSEVIRLTFLRLLSCRPGLFSVKESDSGQESWLLTEPLMTGCHWLVADKSSESLQLATEAVMVEEEFSLYSLASSKLDSEASIQQGQREDSRYRLWPLRRRICRRCCSGLRTISFHSSPSLFCSGVCSSADTRSCTSSSIMVLKTKHNRGN